MNEKAYFSAAALIAAVSASLVWFATLQGPGTTPDSLQYLFSAQDLFAGESLRALSRHWPPGYALLISLLLSLGLEPAWALRVLSTTIAFLNVMLFAACVRPLQGQPTPVSLLATAAIGLSPSMLSVSIMALSEPPFLAFLMCALLGLRAYLVSGSWRALGFAGVFLACALFTRYSGIAFVGLVSLWLFVIHRKASPLRAAGSGAAVAVIAILPLAVWLLWPAGTVSGAAPRTLAFHMVDGERLLQALVVARDWFNASVIGTTFATLIGVASVGLMLWTLRPGMASDVERSFVGLCLGSAIGYFGFLLVSISLFDFYTPLDLRVLCPALVLVAMGVGISASRLALSGPVSILVAASLLTVPMIAGLRPLSATVSATMRSIPGYFNPAVARMPVLTKARQLGDVLIYSNAPELVRLSTGRSARMLPAFSDMVRNEPVPAFDVNQRALLSDVVAGRAVVVYFNAFVWRAYLPKRPAFLGVGGTEFVYDGADGWVLSGAQISPSTDRDQGAKSRI